MMKILNARDAATARAIQRAEKRRTRSRVSAQRDAKSIIADVRRDGDKAVSALIEKFDRVTIAPSDIVMTPKSVSIERSMMVAIETVIERITRFHERQKPESFIFTDRGTTITHRVAPLTRVGIYAPGGRAVYVSTVMMCAIPALIAGVRDLVVATTPAAADRPEFQYVCDRLGIGQIYRSGGAAAIAAMAFGTQSLERVDKIAGPGNAWVTAAKQLVAGDVGIDMTAGPTELVLIADDSSDPRLVAADLLAQAEHGQDSFVVCITDSRPLAKQIAAEVEGQLKLADPGSEAPACIAKNGLIVLVSGPEEAIDIANDIAPEHLSLHVRNAVAYTEGLTNCGAIFTNASTPVAAGDYIIGPNHVLPTAGSARFTSPLGVYDFVKRSNITTVTAGEMSSLAGMGAKIARFEGLSYHARSLDLRTAEEQS